VSGLLRMSINVVYVCVFECACVRTVSGIELGLGSYLLTQYSRALALSAANNCTCLPKKQNQNRRTCHALYDAVSHTNRRLTLIIRFDMLRVFNAGRFDAMGPHVFLV